MWQKKELLKRVVTILLIIIMCLESTFSYATISSSIKTESQNVNNDVLVEDSNTIPMNNIFDELELDDENKSSDKESQNIIDQELTVPNDSEENNPQNNQSVGVDNSQEKIDENSDNENQNEIPNNPETIDNAKVEEDSLNDEQNIVAESEETKENFEIPALEASTELEKDSIAFEISENQDVSTPFRAMMQSTTSPLDDSGFQIALRFPSSSTSTYSWNAQKNEDATIKLAFYYQNQKDSKGYEPNQLVVTIPGIGALNRNSALKAVDIAADTYTSSTKKRDWSYKYDSSTDTYTFYNNKKIEPGELFNGSFEIIWQFNSRNCVNGYTKEIQATLFDGKNTILSKPLNLEFTSEKDTFSIQKTAKSIVSADGLGNFVPEGKTAKDYAWISYSFTYNVNTVNSRGLKDRYMIDTFPKDCIVVSDNKITNSDGTISYKVQESSVYIDPDNPNNSRRVESVLVGYPEENVGSKIKNTVKLYGTYFEENEVSELASSSIDVDLIKIEEGTFGVVPGKYMSPDYIYNDSIPDIISFSANLYATSKAKGEEEYTLVIADDLLEIYTDQYYTLTDDQYCFNNVTIPGMESFYNANGYKITDGDYNVKVFALEKGKVKSRNLSEYEQCYTGKWAKYSTPVELPDETVAIRVEISGLKESINNFYVSTSGEIYLEESGYENPSFIKNYDYTDILVKDPESESEMKSILPELTEKNSSDERIYNRDIEIYGKLVYRSSDTIQFKDRTIQPVTRYYNSKVEMENFEMDESLENFETLVTHSISVENDDLKELKNIEIHGVCESKELKQILDNFELVYSNLKFKKELPAETDLKDYLMERLDIEQRNIGDTIELDDTTSTVTKSEIIMKFDFSNNPIIANNFTLGFKVKVKLSYDDYYISRNPVYSTSTYGYVNEGGIVPRNSANHDSKLMSHNSTRKSILLALASHQQMIKSVKTEYTTDFIQENAVQSMNSQYTYRLKLRNGYNTLMNTEIVDFLEQSEVIDEFGEKKKSEWSGIFQSVDTSNIANQNLPVTVYYSTSLAPIETDWVQLEKQENNIWTTENKNVKAIKVDINGDILENAIIYADINMLSPNDDSLEDKKTYNQYSISCDSIDLYTGVLTKYMEDLPSNTTGVKLVKREYNLEILKTDEITHSKLVGAFFGLYLGEERIRGNITDILGKTTLRGIKAGTYTLKEDIVPVGYKKLEDMTLEIGDLKYSLKIGEKIISEGDVDVTGGTPTVKLNIVNERAKRKIKILKLDEYNTPIDNEPIPLANVEFQLINESDEVIQTKQTNESGEITFDEVDWGQFYRLKETPIQGYEPLEKSIYLNKSSDEYSITLKNIRKKGTAVLIKKDEVDETRIEGAEYAVYARNPIYNTEGEIKYNSGDLVEKAVTNENGEAIFEGLDWGEYYIKETQTVYGYELSEKEYNFYVGLDNVEERIELTEKEVRSKAKLQVIKVDENGRFLQNVEFGLYDEDGYAVRKNVKRINEKLDLKFNSVGEYGWIQNEDGVWQSDIKELHGKTAVMESNEFEIKEKGSLIIDWSVSSESVLFDYLYYTITNTETNEIIDGQSKKIGGTSYGTQYNSLNFVQEWEELVPGKYKLNFYYKKDGSRNSGLDAGFVKGISFSKTELGEVNKGITDENGVLRLDDIDWGTYYIQEIKSVTGYEKIDTKFKFVVDRETFANNNDTVMRIINEDTGEETSVITNSRKKGKVTLTKYAYDAEGNETDKVLPGAVYELYLADGTLLGEYTTNENGKIEVDKLEWNSYYFQEKEAPKGYAVSDKRIAFVVNIKNADFEVELKAYDKVEAGEIIINKVINKDSIFSAHGNSSFIFKVLGKSGEEEKVTLYRTITFSESDIKNADKDGNIKKTIKIADVDSYKYEITEEENYRYEQTNIILGENARVENNIGVIDLSGLESKKGEITFENTKQSNNLLTDNKLLTNSTQSQYYLIGISATTKKESYEIQKDVLTAKDFDYVLYYSGGQEFSVELSEGITINGKDSYKEELEGDYIVSITYTVNGKKYDTYATVNWKTPSDYYLTVPNDDGAITIIGVNSNYTSPEILYIPRVYNELPVTRLGNGKLLSNIGNVKTVQVEKGIETIGASAFSNCDNIINVDLPKSLKSLGSNAFYDCDKLGSINLSKTELEKIEYRTFYSCGALKKVDFPNTLTYIGTEAFYDCDGISSIDLSQTHLDNIDTQAFYTCGSLTTVTLPNGITIIGNSAFYDCVALKTINLTDSLTNIGTSAFYNCKSLTAINLPETLTSIGTLAFYNCDGLTSIDWPQSVSVIPESIFKECNNLKTVNIPETVTNINNSAFYNCTSLTTINLSENITNIGTYAFYNCDGLTSIEWPRSVSVIQDSTFRECSNLKTVNIPETVTSIGTSAFYNCDELTSVYLPANINVIQNYTFYDCNKLITVDIPDSITSIGEKAFYNDYNIKGINWAKSLVSIGAYAFYNCDGLTSIELPEGVTTIGNYAFQSCSKVTNIDLPSTITSIGTGAFYGCLYLEKMNWPDGVTEILSSAFYDCSRLTSIEIPETVTSIGASAFYGCTSLININLPKSLKSIGSSAFYNCKNLSKITWPSSVVSIADNTFYNCSSLITFDVPATVTSISNTAFNGCSSMESIKVEEDNTKYSSTEDGVLYDKEQTKIIRYPQGKKDVKSYTILNTAKSIDNYAFYGCNILEKIDWAEDITNIGTYAFYNCTNLNSIILPETITNIGIYAFYNCSSITEVTWPSSVATIGDYTFYGCSQLTVIELPQGIEKLGTYVFYNCDNLININLPETITSIGSYAFSSCNNLIEIEWPSKVTSISGDVFYNCTSLERIQLPETLTSIGTEAFRSCSSMQSIYIPSTVKTIGSYAFYGCSKLESIDLSNTLITSIPDRTFYNCTALTNITLPSTVTSIGSYAFYSCKGLQNIDFSQIKITSIGYNAFQYCTNLKNIQLPETLSTLREDAFNGCTNLENIDLSKTKITKIYYNTFYNCTNLLSIDISSKITTIESKAFYNCNKLKTINYYGTMEQFNNISVNSTENTAFKNANVQCK